MKTPLNYLSTRLLLILVSVASAFAPAAFAQSYAPPPPPANAPAQEQPAYTQQELDQILAPIALYPDALLSQILMASTYPLEVVQASRWIRANPGLKGDDAVRVVGNQDWDPSVKSLVAFPQILSMMDEKLDWTQRLGDAFIGQEPQVMDTVQNLRQRAYAAGNLRSNEQIRVEPQGQIIAIEPSSPQVVYVPYYDPTVVYGPWWWPAYPPVYWTPWPGYYVRPGYTVGFAWGGGISVSPGFFFGGFDWHQRRARVVNVNNYYYNRTVIVNRQSNVAYVTSNVNAAPGVWHHDPAHRRGIPYREASLRQQFGSASGASEGRREIRAREAQFSAVLATPPNRPDARASNVGEQTHVNTNARRDRRSADSNLPDARVNGRPNTRGAENNPLNVRNGGNNRSDARMNGRANARADARNFSSRGPDRSQGVPIARTNVPASTPAPPAVTASRPAGIHSGPSSRSANPGASGKNSKNPDSTGKRP